MNYKKRDQKIKYFMIFFISLTFIAGIASVFIGHVDNSVGFVVGFISLISLIAFVACFAKFKDMQKEKKAILHNSPQKSSEILTNNHSYYQQVDASRRRLDQKKSYTKKKIIPLESLVFAEDSDEYLCMICKLSIRKNQKVLKCPFCQSFFHKEHLLEWLQIANDCPVCNNSLTE